MRAVETAQREIRGCLKRGGETSTPFLFRLSLSLFLSIAGFVFRVARYFGFATFVLVDIRQRRCARRPTMTLGDAAALRSLNPRPPRPSFHSPTSSPVPTPAAKDGEEEVVAPSGILHACTRGCLGPPFSYRTLHTQFVSPAWTGCEDDAASVVDVAEEEEKFVDRPVGRLAVLRFSRAKEPNRFRANFALARTARAISIARRDRESVYDSELLLVNIIRRANDSAQRRRGIKTAKFRQTQTSPGNI